MTSKKSKPFSKWFAKWRKESVEREARFRDTALLISDYVDATDWDTIKQGLQNAESSVFKTHFETYKARSFGTFVYCWLSLKDYLHQADSSISVEEKELLQSLLAILEALYDNPRSETKKRLKILIDGVNYWLDNYVNPIENREIAEATCRSIYTIFKVCSISLNSLPLWGFKYFIDIDAIKAELNQLIIKAESKGRELAQQLPVNPEPVLVEKEEALNKDQMLSRLDEMFRQNYLALLTSSETSLPEKLSEVGRRINDTPALLEQLAKCKLGQKKLPALRKASQSLLAAVESNENKLVGRKYFLDLIAENQANYDLFMGALGQEQKQGLVSKVAQLTNPSFPEQVMSALEYAMSWATVLTSLSFRYFVSPSMQDVVNSFLPSTLDSECKTELRILLRHYLDSTADILSEREIEITELSRELAKPNDELYNYLQAASFEALTELSAKLTQERSVKIEALETFRSLYISIISRKDALERLNCLDGELNALVQRYNGFAVTLSNFFARLLAFFKTETAKVIDEALALKQEMKDFKQAYEDSISVDIEAIGNDPHIFQELKDSLYSALAGYSQDVPNDISLVSRSTRASEAYRLVKGSFFSLREAREEFAPSIYSTSVNNADNPSLLEANVTSA